MTLTVYGSVLSPFVRKVHVFLMEKRVPFEAVDLNPVFPPDDFEIMSPLKRIPVLSDASVSADWTLADSSAICAYLERRHPDAALYPSTDQSYADCLWLEEYADTEFSHTIGQKVFRPAVVMKLVDGTADMNAAARAFEQDLPPFLTYLERQLSDTGYFVGDTFSLADISVAVHLQNLAHAGFSVPEDAYPKLSRFSREVLDRPSFRACRRAETELLAALGFAK